MSETQLDRVRLERALRAYIADLDYDIHKSIECGEDHYPEHVATFLGYWRAAK
ncbi:hypothetical protein [Streptomyces sp. NBC_01212]|uniref:hypothetical protein n=1 Tax=Streptomyces sp. NBC_01212 TaxID=2903775 RepID=UPI002E160E85|nr:hypothetical protein OG722_04990 [Streptomyces sp. NBC_01212]